MTNPPTKERLQAISDERLAQLITIERGRSALYVETAIQGQTLTLVEDRLSALLELQSLRALQSLDREGDAERYATICHNALVSISLGSEGDEARTTALDALSRAAAALSPQPETAKDDDDLDGRVYILEQSDTLDGGTALTLRQYDQETVVVAYFPPVLPQPETAKEAPREKALSRISQKLAEEGGGTWAAYMMLEIGEAYGCSPAAKEVGETEAVSMTAEEVRLENLKQMAQYAGPIVSFDVREPFYLASCDKCGWVGSSELCGTDSFGDDSDVYCPRCSASGVDCGKIAEALAHPAPQKPPAPVVDEGMVERALDGYGLSRGMPSIHKAKLRAALKAALEGRS